MSEMLMSKCQRRLFGLITRFVKDEHDINDTAQKAMIKIYRVLPGFHGKSAFYTQLHHIAVNTVKNFLITSGKRLFVSAEAANEEGDILDLFDQVVGYHTPETEIANREILQAVETAISKLPDDLRKATTLREVDGLSCEEIAQIVGCPIGTVRSWIFRAHEATAKDLRPLLDTSENQRWRKCRQQ